MKYIAAILLFIVFGVSAEAAPAPKKNTEKKPTAAEIEKKKDEKDFQTAEALLYRQQTKEALPELVRLCGKNYLRACSLLGFGYYSGRYGIPQETKTGIEWYQKCADKEKNFFCHKELGRIYYRMGDYDSALAYYKKAALGNDPDGQYWLGRLYMDGRGLHADYEKALKWMRKAAHARKAPSKPARCALVEMSYFGIGMRRSIKDTKYWLGLCDNPLVQALMSFYGHGVPKDKEKAKEILIRTDLQETLADWNDLNGQSRPSVGKKTIRDQLIPEDCLKNNAIQATGRKNPKISAYAVKIFDQDFYRSFDVHDGYIEKAGIGDQTFEVCGITFYTTLEHKRLFNKALKSKDVIKISRYTNACLGSEMTDICDLNLSWQEQESEEDQ
ncbi:MAG: sel1 repeat family protein [Alphaproteobacteria bacterium]|nr:sel1 repeat family protein [Alphaproteobacteria bacterium]